MGDAANRLFLTTGRWVKGEAGELAYDEDKPNGGRGSIKRLYHFARFRRLAREAELDFDFSRVFSTPSFRRVMAQVVQKDWTLRYSTGALETQLFQLGTKHISWRGGWLRNRHRTDALLMLLQLEMLHVADADRFLGVIEHWSPTTVPFRSRPAPRIL